MNWWLWRQNWREGRRGTGRHVSLIPLVTQILVGLARVVEPEGSPHWLPGWFYLLVAFAGVSWLLLARELLTGRSSR
jgi:hypothetical protein